MASQFPEFPLPGVVILLYGIAWSWTYAAPKIRGLPSTVTPHHGCCRCWPRLFYAHPFGGLIKLGAGIVGIAASLFVAYPDGTYRYVGDAQYVTIFLFFWLSGATDVLSHYAPHCVSRGAVRYAMGQAFFMEGLLFASGEGSSDPGVRRAELLLVAAAIACGVVAVLGGVFPGVEAFRCAAALVHGSWYVQLTVTQQIEAVRRHDPVLVTPEPPASHRVLWVSLAFAWHCAGAFLFLLLLLLLRRRPCKQHLPRQEHHSCPMCDVAFQLTS